jgi:hypothetical protein
MSWAGPGLGWAVSSEDSLNCQAASRPASGSGVATKFFRCGDHIDEGFGSENS